jgi:hypothetical protein
VIASIVTLASISKIPFYIAGALFAVWAVVLAAMGLNQVEFPGGQRGQRTVVSISLLLAAVTIAMAIKTSTFGA